MPETQNPEEMILGKERASMLETILLLAFCLFMGLLSLAVCVWQVVTGRAFTLDGLWLVLISLTIGGFLMFNVVWSIHTGEFQEVLKHLRKK